MTIRASQELIWESKEIAAIMISEHEVHSTSLSGYDVQQKNQTNYSVCKPFTLGNVISSPLLSRFEFNNRSVTLFTRTTVHVYMELFPAT